MILSVFVIWFICSLSCLSDKMKLMNEAFQLKLEMPLLYSIHLYHSC